MQTIIICFGNLTFSTIKYNKIIRLCYVKNLLLLSASKCVVLHCVLIMQCLIFSGLIQFLFPTLLKHFIELKWMYIHEVQGTVALGSCFAFGNELKVVFAGSSDGLNRIHFLIACFKCPFTFCSSLRPCTAAHFVASYGVRSPKYSATLRAPFTSYL